jgi:hypothetical protein
MAVGKGILFVGFILFCGCKGPAREAATQQEREVHDSVRAMLLRYHQQVRTKGLLAEFDFLDSSSAFFWWPPGYKYKLGYDSVRDILERTAPSLKKVDNHFEFLQIIPLSPTQALYAGLVNSTVTDTEGRSSVTRLREEGLVVKREEGWKLLLGKTTVADK